MIKLSDIMDRVKAGEDMPSRNAYSEDFWSMDVMLRAVEEIGMEMDSRFILDKDNIKVYENLIYWMMNDPRMTAVDPRTGTEVKGRLDRGIYLAGNTGSGKTVAMRILRRLYGLNPFVMRGAAVKWMEKRADEMADIFASSGTLEGVKQQYLLCVQDLACEPNETLYMGNRVNVMRSVLEYRGDYRQLTTLITSNIPLGHDDLKARYGERAVSRLMEMTNYLTLTGKDRRQNF